MSNSSFGSPLNFESDKENSLLEYGITASESFISDSFTYSNISKPSISAISQAPACLNPYKVKIQELITEINTHIQKIEEKLEKGSDNNPEYELILKELNTQKDSLVQKCESNSVTNTFIMVAENKQKTLLSEAKTLLSAQSRPPLSVPPLKLKDAPFETQKSQPLSSKTLPRGKFSSEDEEIASKINQIFSLCLNSENFDEIVKILSLDNFGFNFPKVRNALSNMYFSLKDVLDQMSTRDVDQLKAEITKLKIENLAFKKDAENTIENALALQDLHYEIKSKRKTHGNDKRNEERKELKEKLFEEFRKLFKKQNELHKAQVILLENELQKLQNTIKELADQQENQEFASKYILDQDSRGRKILKLEAENSKLTEELKKYRDKQRSFKTKIREQKSKINEEGIFEEKSLPNTLSLVRLEITKLTKTIERAIPSSKDITFLEQILSSLHAIILELLGQNSVLSNDSICKSYLSLECQTKRSMTPNITKRSSPCVSQRTLAHDLTQRSTDSGRKDQLIKPETITFSNEINMKNLIDGSCEIPGAQAMMVKKDGRWAIVSSPNDSPKKTATEMLEEYLISQ
ncbi:unnamed protein product [Blepharisma stoltei]|uniref:Uncharacterized protein n=1 Tax=Blepharisma stoltei TaxID=1481888 RepID=A0AAU9JTV4_9CILI|nr:unnamed protein product [Blepharisma stoltei]